MNLLEMLEYPDVQIKPFDPRFGPLVASWPTSLDELRWLAPSTAPPLTAAKVMAWQKPTGHAYVGFVTNPASAYRADPPLSPLIKGGSAIGTPSSPLSKGGSAIGTPSSPLDKGGFWGVTQHETRVCSNSTHVLPIGYAELNRMRNRRDHLWLGHCIVRPDVRRKGAGLSFVRALVKEAFGPLNAKRVSLIVFPDNAAAVRCYLRAGFEVAGNERQRIGKGGEELTFLRLEMWDPAQLDSGVSPGKARAMG